VCEEATKREREREETQADAAALRGAECGMGEEREGIHEGGIRCRNWEGTARERRKERS
jgi:hypothetical protein